MVTQAGGGAAQAMNTASAQDHNYIQESTDIYKKLCRTSEMDDVLVEWM